MEQLLKPSFTQCLAASHESLRNTESNTASKNRAKRSIYSNRAVTYNQKH